MLNLKFDNWVYNRLSEPFPEEDVKFRSGGRDLIMAYIDARLVVQRLNEVVGAGNWADTYSPVSISETIVLSLDAEGKVLKKPKYKEDYLQREFRQYYDGIRCQLRVLDIQKEDIGSPSYADHLKGATSDSLKRAAVKFGVGAYLYELKGLKGVTDSYGNVIEVTNYPDWALPVERPDPKEPVMALIEKVRNSDLAESDRIRAENIISNIMVMGRYDATAPMVVTRAVYEGLLELTGSGE